jgi:Dipeptidyl aminopeptidases/acylaminoacyl-peptidases
MNPYQTSIADVPCLQLEPAGQPIGTVLLYHGWGSSMESYQFFASLIVGWGYKVVVPELPQHGQRGKLDYANPEVLETQFLEIVLQGVKEARVIVDELSASASGGRIGIIGHSAGGFIAAGSLAKHASLQAAVVINGSCAWLRFEEKYLEYMGKTPLSPEERTALEAHDPFAQLTFEDQRALLLLHGKEDTTVPIDSQRYFMTSRSHVSSEQLHMIEYSGVNHQITLKMLEQSKLWLDRHIAQQ